MEQVNILIVDDHQLVIDGLNNLLKDQPEFNVVGQANNGKRALEILDTVGVDIVLMDIDMPVMGGLEATDRIKKSDLDTKVMILSMHNEHAIIQKVMSMGADGYLLKNSDKQELIEALTKVASGGKYFSSDVTMSLLNKKDTPENKSSALTLSQLTEREIEILKLIAEGLSNKEIGDKLFISHRTVDTHRTNLMRKLEVKNIAGLVKFAIKNGLVE